MEYMKISRTAHKSKPVGKEIALLNKELVETKNVSLSPKELADSVGQGHTVVLGNFEGERKVGNFISTKYLGIDIDDSDVTLEETLSHLESLELTPSVSYYSFSADVTQGKHNHRVFIELDKEVDLREFKLLQLGLMKLIPYCDPACKDGVRIFFGTNSGANHEDEPVEVSHLLYLIKKHFAELDNSTGKKTSETKAFAQAVGIEVINGQLNMGTELESVKWTVSLEEAKSFTKSTRTGVTYKKSPLVKQTIKRELREIDLDSLSEMFPLLEDFFVGNHWATFPEILMIASNLAFIKGGIKKLHETIDNFEFYDNEVHNKDYYHFMIDDFLNRYPEPNPMRWVGDFMQYQNLGINLLVAWDNGKGSIVRIEKEVEKMEIEVAQDLLNEHFRQVLEADGGVHVIKVPTGLGKTEGIVNGLYDGKTVIAFPTHKLIEEVGSRFMTAWTLGHTPTLPAVAKERPTHLLPLPEQEQIKRLQKAGDTQGASKLFSKAVTKHSLRSVPEISEYYKSLSSQRKSQVVLTTHKQALEQQVIDSLNPDLVIIDEDPLMTLFDSVEINISDIENLMHLVDKLPNSYYMVAWLKGLVSTIREAQGVQTESILRMDGTKFVGAIHKVPEVNFAHASLVKKVSEFIVENKLKVSTPVLKLLEGGYFTLNVNVSYSKSDNKAQVAVAESIVLVKKPKLPKAKKVVIFSATANERVYSEAFEGCKFYEIGEVANQGQVVQVHDYNTSKGRIKASEQDIELILEQEGIDTIITFKDSQLFKGMKKPAYLGNTQGYDFLKGNSLAVAGTFNLPEGIYNLLGYAISETLPSHMNNHTVIVNGFRLKLFTFDEGFHRELHKMFIEQELVQAVGRARTLRTDAKVILFSHYPIKQADVHLLDGTKL